MEVPNPSHALVRSPIHIGAAIAILIAAFLPWDGSGVSGSFDLDAAFLWNPNAYEGWFSIGILVLLVGLFAVATLLADRLMPFRRHVGAVAVVVATLWQLQTFRDLIESYTDVLHPLRAMVQSHFALGPWLVFAAGVALVIRR